MSDCPEHRLPFTFYIPSLHLPICPSCPAPIPTTPATPLTAHLPSLLSSLHSLSSFIHSSLPLITSSSLSHLASAHNIPPFDPIFSEIQILAKIEKEFWGLPETRVISEDLTRIDWRVLEEYGVVGEEVEVQRVERIKEFVEKRAEGVRRREEEVRGMIEGRAGGKGGEKGREKERESEQFSLIIEDLSSGEDADDLEVIGVPTGIVLEESYKEIVRVIEKKKMGLSFYQPAGENLEEERLEGEWGHQQVNMKKQKRKEEKQEAAEKVEVEGEVEVEVKVEGNIEGRHQRQNTEVVEVVGDDEREKTEVEVGEEDVKKAEEVLALVLTLQSLIQQKQYLPALSLLSQIPSSPDLLHLQAKLLSLTSPTPSSSLALYQSLLTLSPSDPTLLYESALLQLSSKNYPATKTLLSQLFTHHPSPKPQYYSLRADYLLRYHSSQKIVYSQVTHNPKEIFDNYTEAYNLSHKDPKYLFKIATYHINQREYELAHQMGKEALLRDPTNVSYLRSQAWVSFKLQKFADSTRYYEQIIKQLTVKGASAEVLNNYAISLYFGGRGEGAKEVIGEAWRMYPGETPIVMNLLTIYRAAGCYEQAFEVVKRCLGMLKGNELFVVKACEIAIYLNNPGEASVLLGELSTIRHALPSPTKQFLTAYYTLALSLKHPEVISDGLTTLPLLLSTITSENQKRQLWNTLGMLKVYSGETGLEEFRKAIGCSLVGQEKHAHFWNCSVAAGKEKLYREALEMVERAIELEKRGRKGKYFEWRVWVLVKMYDFEGAVRAVEGGWKGEGEEEREGWERLRKALERVVSE